MFNEFAFIEGRLYRNNNGTWEQVTVDYTSPSFSPTLITSLTVQGDRLYGNAIDLGTFETGILYWSSGATTWTHLGSQTVIGIEAWGRVVVHEGALYIAPNQELYRSNNPVLDSISHVSPEGIVTLTGEQFQLTGSVEINGVAATVTEYTSTEIKFLCPVGSNDLKIINLEGASTFYEGLLTDLPRETAPVDIYCYGPKSFSKGEIVLLSNVSPLKSIDNTASQLVIGPYDATELINYGYDVASLLMLKLFCSNIRMDAQGFYKLELTGILGGSGTIIQRYDERDFVITWNVRNWSLLTGIEGRVNLRTYPPVTSVSMDCVCGLATDCKF